MKFGFCGDLKLAAIAAQAGYDYAEWGVPNLLKPREPESTFRASLDALRAANLPYLVANCFVPDQLKITGPGVDSGALEEYVGVVMTRAEQAGIRIIVFGSGGARRIPDGYDPERAHDQIAAFCRMVAPRAHDHGVTVVVEPLNKTACNVLTTVAECAALVNEVAHPGFRLLVDAYHLMMDGDSYRSIVAHGALLAHTHIATLQHRFAPAAEQCDFTEFFDSLAKANYTGRLSIEANIPNPETELPAALSLLRTLSETVKSPAGNQQQN